MAGLAEANNSTFRTKSVPLYKSEMTSNTRFFLPETQRSNGLPTPNGSNLSRRYAQNVASDSRFGTSILRMLGRVVCCQYTKGESIGILAAVGCGASICPTLRKSRQQSDGGEP